MSLFLILLTMYNVCGAKVQFIAFEGFFPPVQTTGNQTREFCCSTAKAYPPDCVKNAVGNRAKSVSLYYESAGLDSSLALKEKQGDPGTLNY